MQFNLVHQSKSISDNIFLTNWRVTHYFVIKIALFQIVESCSFSRTQSRKFNEQISKKKKEN